MGQYVYGGSNNRNPSQLMLAMGSDSRNPASGARNPFIEYDPGNPWAQGVPSYDSFGTSPFVADRDPTGMSYAQKQGLGRQQHLDEAVYNANMNFLQNPPEWAAVSQQNQPYYFQQQGVTNTANANRDVGLASAASSSQVGLASAAAQQALAQAQLEAAVKQATINAGAAENISSGRNQALIQTLGGLTNALPGIFGGLGQAIGGFGQSIAGGGQQNQQQQQPGLNDPYNQYRQKIAGSGQGSGQTSALLAMLRGQGAMTA